MNDRQTPENPGQPRRIWRYVILTTLIGAVAAGLGAASLGYAQRGGWYGGGRGGFYDADPQTMQRRAEAMVKFRLARIDASEAQQKQIADIMVASMNDLRTLRQQYREAHKAALDILGQPKIDRAALEALRVKEMQLTDQISKRVTQSLADAAEVLTPEQRAKLAQSMAHRHGPRGTGTG